MASLVLSCPAKINLTLEVLGRDPDGYHRIASVMQAISLVDTLTLEPAPGLELTCSDATLQGPDNLVLRAARLLQAQSGCRQGARLHLEKRIPTAAGLGGGSSDAAAALLGLNRLWGLGLPLEGLVEIAVALGSDVPFFLYGGTALVEGRGERVTPLPSPPTAWLVLLRPPGELPDKTRRLYASLGPQHYTFGDRTLALAEALRRGLGLREGTFSNAFAAVAPFIFPGWEEHRRRLVEAGARAVHLAGSGPTLFAFCEDEAQARELASRLEGLESYLVHTL
jgi:4-diphosphocytidyl-2-C-methyl-D-erythritol kinase